MNVLFIFGGLPHYYNAILNRLNRVDGIDIVVAIPKSKGETIGQGVHQTKRNIEFKVIELEEKIAFYKKPYFPKLVDIIQKEEPETIVIIWPYVLMTLFNNQFKKIIKAQKIKLIYKDIPFRIPKFKDSFKWQGEIFFDENMNYTKSTGFLPFLNRAVLGLIRKRFLNKMDTHVFYTEDAFDIITTYGVDKQKIFIIYNSPETNKLFEAKRSIGARKSILPENSNRIIHVGRLVKWKRVDLLIEAINILRSDFTNIELLIIGDGPEKNNLEQQVKELSLKQNVKFIGAVYEPEKMAEYMVSSSIYVLAGMGGLSINEAMAFGKPVICSVCDGTEKKIVREGFNGYYFEQGSKDDLANKIKRLLANPSEIKRMGDNSEKIIREEININTVIKGYLQAFNYITNKNLISY